MGEYPRRSIKFFKHVLMEDVYEFRKYPQNSFDYIFDLGAAVGMFSVMARAFNPFAVVVAVEPDYEAYPYLQKHLYGLYVHTENIAIGDGTVRYRLAKDIMGRTMFSPDLIDGAATVDSIRLSDLFYKYNGKLDSKYYLKVDIEAGEKYLVNHEPTEEVMYHAAAIGMKLHFPSSHPNSPRWYNEPWAEEWSFYNEWWNRLFTDHEVRYIKSSKKTGYGHLLIDRK